MNPNEIDNYVTKFALLIFASGGAWSASIGAYAPALAGGLGALAAIGWSIYANHNQKKVPETAIVVGGGK